MTDDADAARRPFPWWVVLGGLVIALGYLPTLSTPFDFIDDGDLVYPAAAGTTLEAHARLWWEKVAANVRHLGPFRPTLWAHWELFANLLGGDAVAWRALRLAWCGLAASGFLALLRELRVSPAAALAAVAAAVWNPYRNEIWTSLTLAEGVAMPYAMLALLAARRAADARRVGAWDGVALAAWLVCLGCKNVFAALLPALLAFRALPDGEPWREVWRRRRVVALYLVPLALPAAHFVYFQLNRRPGQYETPGPSVAQLGRIASWLKGAAGIDFLGVGYAFVLAGVAAGRARRNWVSAVQRNRAALLGAALLFAAGVAVYLPMPMMAMRYTMPAVWGVDIAFALALTALLVREKSPFRTAAVAAVAVGLAAMFVANVGRQQRFAARAEVLWAALRHVEATAQPNACVEWVSGGEPADSLNAEEGIHFRWHLLNRGRGDVQVRLVTEAGVPIPRVELPATTAPPAHRLRLTSDPAEATFTATYWLGRRAYRVAVEAVP